MKLLILLIAAFALATSPVQGPTALVAGLNIERTLGPGENHIYTVALEEGAAIVGKAEQRGVDLVIDILDPDGKLIRSGDSPNGRNGPEPIDLTAFKSGRYTLTIRMLDAKAEPGKYAIKIDRLLTIEENGQRLAEKNYPPALQSLWRAYVSDPQAVENFVASRKGKGPIIEELKDNNKYVKVTYLYYGNENTESVRTNGGPNGAIGGIRLTRFLRTPLFFGSEVVPKDARYTYSFSAIESRFVGPGQVVQVRDEITSTDKLNPEMFNDSSALTLPEAPGQPYLVPNASVAKGKLKPSSFKSVALKEDRALTIYTPAGYDAAEECELLIVFDGEDHTREPDVLRTMTTLDNLIALKKINPTVAVFVEGMGLRQRDMVSYPPFADFIAKELVPWVRNNYRIARGPNHVVASGMSLGGLAASYCALVHSDTIGNVLSQSGSYWVTKGWRDAQSFAPLTYDTGDLVGEFRKSKRLPIKFYLTIGRFEPAGRMVGTNREFRDVLLLKGYEVTYNEVNGGHDDIWWRGSFADGLLALIGRRAE
jgi:enterochelin esterase-like enzyme